MKIEEAKKLLEDWDVLPMQAIQESRIQNKGEIDWKDLDDVVEKLIDAARTVQREEDVKIVHNELNHLINKEKNLIILEVHLEYALNQINQKILTQGGDPLT